MACGGCVFPFLDWTNRSHDSCTDISLPTNNTAVAPGSLWCSTTYEWTDGWQLCADLSCPGFQDSGAPRFGSGETKKKPRQQISKDLMQANK